MTKWIFIAGMRRSGSALTYHVTREILRTSTVAHDDLRWVAPHKLRLLPKLYLRMHNKMLLVKTHVRPPHVEGEIYCIQSRRNILDSMASQMIAYSEKSWIVDDFEGNVKATLDEFYGWNGFGNLLRLRYGEFATDIPGMAADIAEFLGIKLSRKNADKMGDTFSIARQHERLPGAGYDQYLAMHHNHINNGGNGYYQSVLTRQQIDAIKSIGADYMEEFGYT